MKTQTSSMEIEYSKNLNQNKLIDSKFKKLVKNITSNKFNELFIENELGNIVFRFYIDDDSIYSRTYKIDLESQNIYERLESGKVNVHILKNTKDINSYITIIQNLITIGEKDENN